MADGDTHHMLLYTYVSDILERRGPYREAHLQRIRAEQRSGRVTHAGALGTPPNGGAMVWLNTPVAEIEAFAQTDPYNAAGLITAWRIEPWTLV
jgi:uncharacterized protein